MIGIMRGPLAGIQGRVVRINNKYRLVIAVSSISQAISVEVDVNDIEPIGDTPGLSFSEQLYSSPSLASATGI